MPIGFYSSYPTIQRAYDAAQSNIRVRRAGVFRMYRRLDGRYEVHVNRAETIPPQAELVGAYEFAPLEQVWVPIVEPAVA
jgi:hypothetical protein